MIEDFNDGMHRRAQDAADREDSVDCPVCLGEGRLQWEDEIYDCDDCRGEGQVPESIAKHLLKDMREQADYENHEQDYYE